MSWDISLMDGPTVHDCPNCGGHEGAVVFDANLTYNVGTMIRRAGLHPKVLNGMKVSQAYGIVRNAMLVMEQNKEYFKQFDADNGWGTVDTTLGTIQLLYKAMDEGHDDDILRWE